jgi:chromosome segregation ATPase
MSADTNILQNTKAHIDGIIGNLQQLHQQQAGVEEIDKQREKAQAKLDGVKANTAAMRAEFNEVKHAHDDILKKAQAAQAELEKLEREIKKRKGELAEMKAAIARLPQLERALEAFDAEFTRKAAELSNINAALVKTLRQQQGG